MSKSHNSVKDFTAELLLLSFFVLQQKFDFQRQKVCEIIEKLIILQRL